MPSHARASRRFGRSGGTYTKVSTTQSLFWSALISEAPMSSSQEQLLFLFRVRAAEEADHANNYADESTHLACVIGGEANTNFFF